MTDTKICADEETKMTDQDGYRKYLKDLMIWSQKALDHKLYSGNRQRYIDSINNIVSISHCGHYGNYGCCV